MKLDSSINNEEAPAGKDWHQLTRQIMKKRKKNSCTLPSRKQLRKLVNFSARLSELEEKPTHLNTSVNDAVLKDIWQTALIKSSKRSVKKNEFLPFLLGTLWSIQLLGRPKDMSRLGRFLYYG